MTGRAESQVKNRFKLILRKYFIENPGTNLNALKEKVKKRALKKMLQMQDTIEGDD